MPKPKTIAIVHEKGGVGKTTTTLNLGIGLALEGKKVLLVDCDPQGDLTKCLGISKPNEISCPTLATALDNIILERDFNPKLCIQHHKEGVDFIASNSTLAATEVSLVNSMTRETVLQDFLNMVKQDYHYILVDCCPSLGLLVINALTASNSVIVPVQAHVLASEDMDNLFKTIGRTKRRLNPHLQIDGIVMTMLDSRTNLTEEATNSIRNDYGHLVRVFKTQIPFAIKAAEAPRKGLSIYQYDSKSTVAHAYKNLTKEVMESARQQQKNKSRNIR